MPKFETIALDADDTLWHNERLYLQAQEEFIRLLEAYHPRAWISERLYDADTRNIQHYGYGIKAFGLSMIETAVELTEGRISGREIGRLLDLARGMLSARVELLDGVEQVLPRLAAGRRLLLITKGDLLEQSAKVERSGIACHFHAVEIVSEKTPQSYARILERHAAAPQGFLMAGNSLRSDILPVLDLGGSAVYIPYETTWLHEAAEEPAGRPGYHRLESLGALPALLERLERAGNHS